MRAQELVGHIDFLCDEGGVGVAAIYRGHVDIGLFCEAVNYGYAYPADHARHATPEKVRAIWGRMLPSGELHYADRPGRGAFPITVMEW